MGQKVHPVGFRVGITKPYQSQWFARFHKYQYSQTIVEDRLLRQTLMDLLPKLMNPFLKKLKKREENATSRNSGGLQATGIPKITHIKIERGLIPYQIGIQIHAENCELIKSAIQNLTVSNSVGDDAVIGGANHGVNIPTSAVALAKARRYLFLLKMKATSVTSDGQNLSNQNSNSILDINSKESVAMDTKITKNKNSFQKRLRKRKEIQKSLPSFYQGTSRNLRAALPSAAMIIEKKASRFSVRDLRVARNSALAISGGSANHVSHLANTKKGTLQSSDAQLRMVKRTQNTRFSSISQNKGLPSYNMSRLYTRGTTVPQTKTKILNIFLDKTQKNFLKHLKEQMKYWNQQMQQKTTISFDQSKIDHEIGKLPLGYSKNWSFASFEKNMNAIESISKLTKLIKLLEKRSKAKMEQLRSDFITSGPLSKAQTFGYYQIIRFLKLLKEYTHGLASQQSKNIAKNQNKYKKQQLQKSIDHKVMDHSRNDMLSLWGEKTIQQRLNNIEEESRKMKFIEYLKGIVQKHRKDNIYYYLSNIADSRKNLRKIQQFTKRHAQFLFGFNGVNGSSIDILRDQIRKGLEQKQFDQKGNSNTFADKMATGKEIFLKQIEKQRKINKENCELTPKISLKFYTASPIVVQIKASVVADTIVDALEKRQAFRKVIKDAKKELLKNARVKGVKIQVAGRLNGAEIARTEWVRSGRVPLQTLTANIDYSYKTAKTIYGIIGVKVWIFKGYTNTI